MGEIADELIDNMMDAECEECGGDLFSCRCGRPRRVPPRPETLSMFDDLDEPKKGRSRGKR